MKGRIRVLLADDHPALRAGIRAILASASDMMVAGEVGNGDDARQLCTELEPDVLLLDLNMPGPRPVETVSFLHGRCPELKVIALTAYDDDIFIRPLISAGAAGYILKDEVPEAILRAIRVVMGGDTWYSQPVVKKLAQWEAANVDIRHQADLTSREAEILSLMALGLDNRRIAATLLIAEQTVRNHVSVIYQKLGVTSRTEAVVWARQRGPGEHQER